MKNPIKSFIFSYRKQKKKEKRNIRKFNILKLSDFLHETIVEESEILKREFPKPFNRGDRIVPKYFGKFTILDDLLTAHEIGYIPNKKYRIIVDDCYINSNWLKRFFHFDNLWKWQNEDIFQGFIYIKDNKLFKIRYNEIIKYIKEIEFKRSGKKYLVEWAIIPLIKTDKDLCASSFIIENSSEHINEIERYRLKRELDNISIEYFKKLNQYNNKYK